jgi:hypothetical protein
MSYGLASSSDRRVYALFPKAHALASVKWAPFQYTYSLLSSHGLGRDVHGTVP